MVEEVRRVIMVKSIINHQGTMLRTPLHEEDDESTDEENGLERYCYLSCDPSASASGGK